MPRLKDKEQFANSPDLSQAIVDAIIDALEAHSMMGKQALHSAKVRGRSQGGAIGAGTALRGTSL